jgi:hypothetical protein
MTKEWADIYLKMDGSIDWEIEKVTRMETDRLITQSPVYS